MDVTCLTCGGLADSEEITGDFGAPLEDRDEGVCPYCGSMSLLWEDEEEE